MEDYEAMFIVSPELNENAKKELFNKIKDIITKNNGKVVSADIWSEKRKLFFPIKRHREGIYYCVNFKVDSRSVSNLTQEYKLNENILRVLITNVE